METVPHQIFSQRFITAPCCGRFGRDNNSVLNYFKACKGSMLVHRLRCFCDFEFSSTTGCVECCHSRLSVSLALIVTDNNFSFWVTVPFKLDSIPCLHLENQKQQQRGHLLWHHCDQVRQFSKPNNKKVLQNFLSLTMKQYGVYGSTK